MKKLLVSLLVALGTSLSAVAADPARPEISRYVKAYAGQEGIKVWTLRIGPVEKNESLFQVTGIDHPWDMRIQKVKTEQGERGTKYVANVEGKRFVVMSLEGNRGELHLPGTNSAKGRVDYDAGLSQEGNAEHFLTDYLKQK
jgi:hypothetical protein